jgi:hypothetical protein
VAVVRDRLTLDAPMASSDQIHVSQTLGADVSHVALLASPKLEKICVEVVRSPIATPALPFDPGWGRREKHADHAPPSVTV